jgi:two-component system sensor histidine kinase KdpD
MAEAPGSRRERLKIFLGYASGVGKSFRMLDEARRRHERGQDVVVGAIQPQRSADLDELLSHLEVIPPKIVDGVPVVDVDAILRRRPRVCVIDGLAYNNPPGSRHPYRWQDVQELVDSGISVIASVNLQYIEEEREKVEAITGKRVTQTIPKAFLYGADEIVVVDMAPQSVAGSEEKVAQQLSALRELALLLTADIVDRQLETYLESRGMDQLWGAHERFLVCVTPRTNASSMIAAAKRSADRFHGELYAAYVEQPELSPRDREALDANLAAARDAGAKIEMLGGEDFVATILDYARSQRITQILIGHSLRHGWWDRLRGGPIDRLISASDGMDLRVFPH